MFIKRCYLGNTIGFNVGLTMVKTVTIKNVEEADWDALTGFAEKSGITMAELISIIADEVRNEKQSQNLIDFVMEQRKRRRKFIRKSLGFG